MCLEPIDTIDVSGRCDDRRDRHQRHALVAGEQHLGLVGDREVDLAGLQQLQRQRRVGRDLDVDVEAGLLEVAVGQRLVEPT